MPDLPVRPEDFGPSKPADDLDDMFGPESKPVPKTSREAWELWARYWDLKEEKKSDSE